MKNLILAFAILLHLSLCGAEQIQLDKRENLRCIQLLPNLIYPVAVEFAIPKDFVAMSSNGKPCLSNWVYWGRPDVLAEYFKDPDSLSEPILRVRISDIPQSSLYEPCFDDDEANSGFNVVTNFLSNWGMHPIRAVNIVRNGFEMFFASLGLNARNEETLLFNILFPNNIEFNESGLDLWKTFLEKTKPLPSRQSFLAHGQDIYPGVTIVTCNTAWNTAKVKAIGEKRIRDQKIKVAIELLDDNVAFECTNVFKSTVPYKEEEWSDFEVVKISSWATEHFGKDEKNVFHQVISVLIKPVEEFSFPEEDPKIAWQYEL